MDKEDALIVFEEHIRQMENEENEEKSREVLRIRRQQRKNRETFLHFLDELHAKNQLNSMSLWCELYPIISADQRFHNMLGQPGSTSLDLFKFYVEDLKGKFAEEKKLIKDILKEKSFTVELNTTYEQFQKFLNEDNRAASIDSGNMKLTYNSLIEKAEAKEKERQKDEQRKRKRLESSFRAMLRHLAPPVDPASKWEDIRPRICHDPSFEAVNLEADRIAIFNDYIKMISEACAHHHGQSKKRKKNKKQKKAATKSLSSSGESEGEIMKETQEVPPSISVVAKKHKKKKKKDESADVVGDDGASLTKHKKRKRKRSPSVSLGSETKKGRLSTEFDVFRRNSRPDPESDEESGELSELELEEKRKLLLKELQRQA